MKRRVFSLHFILCAAAVAAACFASAWTDVKIAYAENSPELFSSIKEVEIMLTFDKFKCVMAAIMAILCADLFAADCENQYLRHILSRIPLSQYVIVRVMVVLCSCIIVTVTGFLLFAGMILPCMWWPISDGNMVAMRFLNLASGKYSLLYLILLGFNFGMSSSVACVMGMWMTLYRHDRFIAVGGSVLAFYFLYALSILLPDCLSYEVIGSRFNQREFSTNWGLVLYHAVFFFVLLLASGGGFYISARRRMKNGRLA